MIITRAPLRISFAGGGTDLPAFYRTYGPGAVLSTSINRYVYVTLNKKFENDVSIRYRKHELKSNVSQIEHPLIRECLLHYGIHEGIEIVVISEVPARGSGLGASSALGVALCLALEKFTGKKSNIAETASMIEIEKVGSPIGKQDQYASYLGGFNFHLFRDDNTVETKNYPHDEFINEVEQQSMLFYLNLEHGYQGGGFVQKILRDQIDQMDDISKIHELQRDNALQLNDHMQYAVMERFMDHINENWRLKKMTHSDISNDAIDAVIQKAYRSGATAAKVCGSGGGGFLYLIVPPSMQNDVRKAMRGLYELKFKFDDKGAQCIFDDSEIHVKA